VGWSQSQTPAVCPHPSVSPIKLIAVNIASRRRMASIPFVLEKIGSGGP
jgi:hypothetical protein